MSKNKRNIYGRIASFWPLLDGGICAQLQEQRGASDYAWKLTLGSLRDLDFEHELDGLTLAERAFLLGALLGCARDRL